MAEIRCPQCGKPNPKELEECQFCGARIKPLLASTPVDSKPVKAGEVPIKRNTSEFEKVKPLDEGPIHPGDAPFKRDTGELEKALPTWLQSLRKPEDAPVEETPAATGTGEAPETPSEGVADWLSGLGKAGSDEDEEVPDWLSGLRTGGQPGQPQAAKTGHDSSSDPNDTEWMKAISKELRSGAQDPTGSPLGTPAPAASPSSAGEFPDWLEGLKGDPAEVEKLSASSSDDSDTPSWLAGLPGEPVEREPSAGFPSAQEPPAWLDMGKEKTPEPQEGAGSTPDWMSGLPGITGASEPGSDSSLDQGDAASGITPAEAMPDWVNQLKQKAAGSEPASGFESDWVNNFGTEPGTPASAPGESVPEWLSNLEEKSGPGTPAAVFGGEIADGGSVPRVAPDWLSQLQADANAAQEAEKHKDEFEVAPQAEKKETGPLPDWLAGIERTPAAANAAPALIVGNESNISGQEGEAAFSMESPDWLSKLTPEESRENTDSGGEEEASTQDLETSELPSWVQAMRPVEAVVSKEPKSTPLEDVSGQVTEQSGPLAGLQGVLPSAPGLGPLRKPPAYSIKLQVTETQQKYAAYLERLVMQETEAKGPGVARLASSRVWRWLITGLLFLAILIPFFNVIPAAPSSSLNPPEMTAAFTRVGNLSPDSVVLVVFDYDPALFGEMEAAAGPMIDHLLLHGPRLAFISTSPTGPVLAERFMLDTQAEHQYKLGEQYVNLGYLAGGPSGVLGFASQPRSAAGTSADWQSLPMQGVEQLRDFDLIIVITDNADAGRVWIEQTRTAIDNGTPDDTSDDTPILMAISAQAEPMLLPYYDSGQIQGVVTGLVGGKTYEQQRNRPALANQYWNSFSAGTFVAVLLMIAGAVWGAVSGWRARKNKTGEEA